MSTFGAMKSRIAVELDRTDLTSSIGAAILSAIRHHSAEPWWFLEATEAPLSTTAGVATVALPAGFVSPVDLLITDNGSTYPLLPRTVPYMDDRFVTDGADEGTPTDYALYASQIRLWPIPDAIYPLTLRQRQELAELVADADTNAWTTVAEEMIRSRAEADVRRRHLMEPEARQEALAFAARGEDFLSAGEKAAWIALRRRQHGRVATGRLRPTRF